MATKGEYVTNKYLLKLSFFFLILTCLYVMFVRYAMYECKSISTKIDRIKAKDKVIVITGANSGLGYHSSLVLSQAGAVIVMGARNLTRGHDARLKILSLVPGAKLSVYELNLASFESVKKFARSVMNDFKSIDVLMNNAAEMAIPTREMTIDNNERQMETNHLSHFLLTGLLLPKISKTGRIVNVASAGYILSENSFPEDLQSSKYYNPWVAYGNSKFANLLFTYELNKRLQKAGSSIKSIATHPGYTATNLQVDRYPFWEYSNALFAMDLAAGSLSQIVAALDPDIEASYDNFLGPKYVIFGAPYVEFTGKSTDEARTMLWEKSVKITGNNFGKL